MKIFRNFTTIKQNQTRAIGDGKKCERQSQHIKHTHNKG